MAESVPVPDLNALLGDGKWAYMLARCLVHDDHLAEDIAQTAHLAALEHPPPAHVPLRPWLAGVVRNLARMAVRTASRRRRREQLAAAPELRPSIDDLAERADLHRRLATFILELEEPYRSTCLLRFFDDLTPQQIAERLGVPGATVRSRLKRALARLRERLEADQGTEWRAALLPLLRAPAGGTAIGGPMAMATKALAAVLGLAVVGAVVAWRMRTTADYADPPRAPGGSGEAAASPGGAGSNAPAGDAIAAAPLPPSAPRGLAGRVVGATGQHVAGARVFALPVSAAAPVTIGAQAPDPAAVGSALTDEHGHFVVLPPTGDPLFALAAVSEGHGPGVRDSRRPGEKTEIVLDPPTTWKGTVRDTDGNPVADAHLTGRALIAGFVFERETRSGADGGFELQDLPTSSPDRPPASLAARAAGHAPGRRRVPPAVPGSTIELALVLHGGTTIEGTVSDADSGQPVLGATVAWWTERLERFADGPCGRSFVVTGLDSGTAQAVTDAAGKFRLDHLAAHEDTLAGALPSGRRFHGTLGVRRDGYAPHLQPVVRDAGTSLVLELRIRRGATIRGRVFDARGAPLPDVAVWRLPRVSDGHRLPEILGGERGRVTTGTGGDYEFRDLECGPAGRSDVEIVASRIDLAQRGAVSRRFILQAGTELAAGPIVLPDPRTIDILVVDGTGDPVSGAAVSQKPLWSPADLDFEPRRTDREGRTTFTLDPAPPPGRNVLCFFATAPGFGRGRSIEIEDGPQIPASLTIRVPAASALRCRVLGADGTPASGAWIAVAEASRPPAETFALEPEVQWRLRDLPGPYLGLKKIRLDGTAAFEDLPPGPYHVAARTLGPDGLRSVVRTVDRAGSDEIVLMLEGNSEAPAGDQGFELVLVDAATRAPVLDAYVFFHLPPIGRAPDEQALGVYRWRWLEPGPMNLEVQADGYRRVRRVVEIGATPAEPLVVALDRGLTIEGRIEVTEGPRLASATIGFSSLDGELARNLVVQEDQTFLATGIVPGTMYHVMVREATPQGAVFLARAGGKPWVAPLADPGEPVVLTVAPASLVHVRLPGAAEHRAALTIFDMEGTRVLGKRRPPAEFKLALAPGRLRFVLEDDRGVAVERIEDLPSGRPFDLDLGQR